MIETMIKVAINEALDMIDKEVEKIQAKFTGGMKMPF